MPKSHNTASRVHLPLGASYPTILSFLVARFPFISVAQWTERINSGQVCFLSGGSVTLQTPYKGGIHVSYYKSVANEQPIPFQAEIVYQDQRILVACKPHFLAVLPAGRFIQENLLSRLQAQTKNPDLSPAHRIDRGTAGLVLFCKQVQDRGLYQNLFKNRQVQKEYQAVCHKMPQAKALTTQAVEVWKHQIIKATDPWFTMTIDPHSQKTNAKTEVRCLATEQTEYIKLELRPITGKKHQLRVQLAYMGYPIVNDRFYPEVQPESPDCFDSPLQLLASQLSFIDPITQASLCFKTTRQLKHR